MSIPHICQPRTRHNESYRDTQNMVPALIELTIWWTANYPCKRRKAEHPIGFKTQQNMPQFALSALPLTQGLSKRSLLHFISIREHLHLKFLLWILLKLPPSPTNATVKLKTLCLRKVAHEPHPGLAMTHSYHFKGREKKKTTFYSTLEALWEVWQCRRNTWASLYFGSFSKIFKLKKKSTKPHSD